MNEDRTLSEVWWPPWVTQQDRCRILTVCAQEYQWVASFHPLGPLNCQVILWPWWHRITRASFETDTRLIKFWCMTGRMDWRLELGDMVHELTHALVYAMGVRLTVEDEEFVALAFQMKRLLDHGFGAGEVTTSSAPHRYAIDRWQKLGTEGAFEEACRLLGVEVVHE